MEQALAPQQERSRKTHTALLDSAEALGREKPFGRISVQEVASGAGFTIGAFYARFPTKKALLEALAERYGALIEKTRERLAAAPADERLVSLFAEALASAFRDRRGLMLLLRSAAEEHPDFDERLQALRVQVLDLAVEAFGRAFPLPRPALEAAVLLLVSPLRELYLTHDFWPAAGEAERQRLTEATVEAVLGSLRAASAEPTA